MVTLSSFQVFNAKRNENATIPLIESEMSEKPVPESTGRRRATVRDVAKLAGVGTMTVSRVVNESGYVKKETRERVRAAIFQLGYLPNQSARNLRVQRSGTIALIVTDITNPFFTTVARGVEDVARGAKSLVLLGNTDEDTDEENRYLKLLVQKGVDGVILVPAHGGSEALEMASRHQIPTVVVDRAAPPGFDCIRGNSEQGAYELASYLCSLGHRNIALLGGPEDVSTSKDRVMGFVRATEATGAKITMLHGQFSVADGARMASEITKMSPRPTAIFACNNFIAIGALAALRDAHIRVPEDISVVGFDDLPENLITFPFLTVCSQPSYELGVKAATRLFERIDKPEIEAVETLIDTELIIRSSAIPAH
jgi:LacI family transcriptional regulator